MKKVLIATHGNLAKGFKDSLKILYGDNSYIYTINAYTDECPGDYTKDIEAFIESIGEFDEGIIFTDLMSGSVNQKVCQVCLKMRRNVPVVTDVNLMIILATILESRPLSQAVIQELVEMCNVKHVEINLPEDENENSFFNEGE